jgi:RNA polymerase-binding transcription factor DksA
MRIHCLREALRRMDLGDYGIRSACREWISRDRLRARPEILKCSGCESESESSG